MKNQSTEFVIAPAPQAVIPVVDGGLFPVRRIFCVARNYAEHAREMGGDPEREAPFFFTKPADAVLPVGQGQTGRFVYPPASRQTDHEVELVVALRSGGTNMDEAAAADCIFGYAVGLDMTRRDLQREAQSRGRPWDAAKAFDLSAPVSSIVPMPGKVVSSGEIALELDDGLRQRGDLSQMIWGVPETLALLSKLFRLQAGDLIFTGTPEGVGPVQVGNTLRGRIAGIGELRVTIVSE